MFFRPFLVSRGLTLMRKCMDCGAEVPIYLDYLCERCWAEFYNGEWEKERITMARIAVDIDGVLANKLDGGKYPEDYMKKQPLPYAREGLRKLKQKGYYVILFTARFEEDREITEKWLKEHGFDGLYDELVMGKLQYDVLIDDRAIRHYNWFSTLAQVEALQESGKWF